MGKMSSHLKGSSVFFIGLHSFLDHHTELKTLALNSTMQNMWCSLREGILLKACIRGRGLLLDLLLNKNYDFLSLLERRDFVFLQKS